MAFALARDRSMTAFAVRGIRSLIRTSTERRVGSCTTRTRVPNGSVRWAAVSRFGLNGSPLAVRPGCWYQVARPVPIRRDAAGLPLRQPPDFGACEAGPALSHPDWLARLPAPLLSRP